MNETMGQLAVTERHAPSTSELARRIARAVPVTGCKHSRT